MITFAGLSFPCRPVWYENLRVQNSPHQPPISLSLDGRGNLLVNRGGAASCGRSVPLGGVYRAINIHQPTPEKKNGKGEVPTTPFPIRNSRMK